MELQLEDLKNYVKLAREGAYFGKYSEAINTFKKAIESVLVFKAKVTEQYVKQAWNQFEQDLQSELDIISELQAINQGFKPNPQNRKNNNQVLGENEGKGLIDQNKKYPFGKAPFSHIEEKVIPPQSADGKNCQPQKNMQFQQGAYQQPPPQSGYGQQYGYGQQFNGHEPSPQNNNNNNGPSPQNGNNYYSNQPNPGYNDNIFQEQQQQQGGYGYGNGNGDAYPRVPRTGYANQKDPGVDPDVWPAPPPIRKQNKAQQQKKVGIYNLKDLNNPQNNNNNNNGNQKDKKRDYPKPWQKNASEQQTPNGKKKGDGEGEKKKSFLHFVYPEGSGPDSDLISMLERDVVDQNPNISFDQIAELDKAKDMLQEAVLLPILIPQYFRGIRRPLKGVLMFGPPGTGKTMLAKAVATTGKTTFFNVSASSLASKWRGDSEKLVRILFEMARYYSPSTIFFDEIDAIGSKRVDGECEANRKMKAEMLIQIDGVSSSSTEEKDRKQVMVLAATNRPWDLDEALRRRLEKRILIPLPSTLGRMQLFKLNMQGINCSDNLNWDDLVKNTDGYSGADIASLCREASFMPMRRKLLKEGGFKNIENIENLASESDIPLTQSDFEEALRNVNKSVSNDDLENFEKWMVEFGSV